MAPDMTAPVLVAAKPRAELLLRPFVAVPAILFVVAMVFLPSLNDWFMYHDYIHLGAAATHSVGDYAKRVLDPGDGGESLFTTGRLYRPTYYLTMLVEERAFGLSNPFPYHLVNFSMHLLNVFLVFLIARKLTRDTLVSYVAALVYGLHPIFYEAPIWISAITEVLLATFSFVAIYFFIRHLEERGLLAGVLYGATLVSAVLALGAREPGVSIFLILPAYYFLVHAPHEWRQPRAWLRFAPFFAVLGVYAIMRYSITTDVASGEGGNAVGSVGWHMFTNVFLFNQWAVVPIYSNLGAWFPAVTGFAAILLMRVHEEFFFRGGGVGRFLVFWWYVVVFTYSTAGWIKPLIAGRYLYMALGAFAILCGLAVPWLADLARRWFPAVGSWAKVVAYAAVPLVIAPALIWGTLHHEDSFAWGAGESHKFVDQLRDSYDSLPAGSMLYVVNTPKVLLFADGPFFLTPAVRWYYPGVTAKNISPEEAPGIHASMGENDHILVYRP